VGCYSERGSVEVENVTRMELVVLRSRLSTRKFLDQAALGELNGGYIMR
jgi:hypothetical protein